MAEVIPFDATQRRDFRFRDAQNERLRREQESGNHAWGRLKKCRRLTDGDRNALAKAMYKILNNVKQLRPDISQRQLAEKAGFSDSKELYRLTLPPGIDPAMRRVRTEPNKYIRLVEAIQKLTGGNLSLLADSLTYDTSFHPKQTPGTEESEKIINALQGAINQIDQGFRELSGGDTLFETFMKTAQIKAELAKEGCVLHWPYVDFVDEIINDTEPQFTYWKRNYGPTALWNTTALHIYESWVSHHDALMQLPRIYLGSAEWQTYLFGSRPEEGFSFAEHKNKAIEDVKSGRIGEVRDPITGDACIAHRHPKTGEWMPGINGTYDDEHVSADGCDDVWLVIYPSPDNRSLIPLIYHPCEESGTLLTPLTERSLIALKNLTFVDDGEPRSMYVRIKELMGFGSGEFTICKQWQATAGDVLRNPILRAHRDQTTKQNIFDQTIKDFWESS